MRVLSVIETLRHGGAETVLVQLVSGLPQHDHAVVHFSRFHNEVIEPWIAGALERAAVPCHDVEWGAFAHLETRTIDGGFTPDVVIYHWWGQHPLGPWLAACRRLPVAERPFFVVVLHRSRVPAPAGFDAYVLVSPSQAAQVAHVEPGRVQVIPNGVDLARFRDVPDRPPEQRFTVGRLSNLRHGKIPPDWVRTLASFNVPNARFVIPGEGALRSALEGDVRLLRLEDSVSLPGYVAREDVPALLATFDVFCYVTSTAVECHPLALLEAAAAGLPIVAEARGGIPDIVQHGTSGLLARSIDEVGEYLRLLERDRSLGIRLGKGARDLAAQYSLERQLKQYAELLDRATVFRT